MYGISRGGNFYNLTLIRLSLRNVPYTVNRGTRYSEARYIEGLLLLRHTLEQSETNHYEFSSLRGSFLVSLRRVNMVKKAKRDTMKRRPVITCGLLSEYICRNIL